MAELRCDAELALGGQRVRCQLGLGHEGEHSYTAPGTKLSWGELLSSRPGDATTPAQRLRSFHSLDPRAEQD